MNLRSKISEVAPSGVARSWWWSWSALTGNSLGSFLPADLIPNISITHGLSFCFGISKSFAIHLTATPSPSRRLQPQEGACSCWDCTWRPWGRTNPGTFLDVFSLLIFSLNQVFRLYHVIQTLSVSFQLSFQITKILYIPYLFSVVIEPCLKSGPQATRASAAARPKLGQVSSLAVRLLECPDACYVSHYGILWPYSASLSDCVAVCVCMCLRASNSWTAAHDQFFWPSVWKNWSWGPTAEAICAKKKRSFSKRMSQYVMSVIVLNYCSRYLQKIAVSPQVAWH